MFRKTRPPDGWRPIGEKPISQPVDLAALGERMAELNKPVGVLREERVPFGPPPPSGEERVTIERAETFNRTRSAVQRAREAHKRAVRQADELVQTALAVLEDAEEHYREAALALRRVSSS